MTERMGAVAGGALAGAALALVELGVVLAPGRLMVDGALGLGLAAALAGAALGAPGGLLGGRGLAAGAWGAAALWVLAEVALLVVTDPPPFQPRPWTVGSVPLALGAGIAALALRQLGARWPWVRLTALGALGWAVGRYEPATAAGASPPSGAPDVVVVTLDTTRADRLGPWGGPSGLTPGLDALAAEGVVFEAAFAPIAVTGPSHTSLWSGQGTWRHGVLLNGVPVPPELPLLAERLQAAGWQTGAFVSAYVLNRAVGLGRGFTAYDDDFAGHGGLDALLPARLGAALGRRLAPDEVLERRGDLTVDAALRWLGAQPADRPVLLWVHLFDPHGPYTPPEPYASARYQGDPRDPANPSMQSVSGVAPYLLPSLEDITDLRYVLAMYEGELAFADAQLRRLVQALDARAGREVLLVVAGDHGESLGEHGVWFNHGDDLYDASLHVPLLLRWPGRLPAGARVDGVVELVDVAPTVLDLLGLDPLPATDGASLLPQVQGAAEPGVARAVAFDRPANVAERERGHIAQPTWRVAAVRAPLARYVLREAEGYEDQLFTAPEGWDRPGRLPEANQLPGLRRAGGPLPPEAEALRAQAAALLAGEAGVERSAVELPEEERRRLEALGYLE